MFTFSASSYMSLTPAQVSKDTKTYHKTLEDICVYLGHNTLSSGPLSSPLRGHNDANLFSLSLIEQLIYPEITGTATKQISTDNSPIKQPKKIKAVNADQNNFSVSLAKFAGSWS